jgi:LPXTG-site transpeptidase (sortase) family protein
MTQWNQRQMQNQWQREAAQWRQATAETVTPPAKALKSTSDGALASRKTSSRRQQPKKPKTNVLRRTRPAAWPPTRLVIPDISLDLITVQGISHRALRRGPGHDPASAWPGERGNCIIAGHRNVWGSPFWRLNELGPGDKIELWTPQERLIYQVSHANTVAETDSSALSYPRHIKVAPRLTLYTCTLPKTADRLLVVANLVERSSVR